MPTLETPLADKVRAALNGVKDPVSGKGLSASGRIAGLVARADGRVGFVLETSVGEGDEPLRQAAEQAALGVPGVTAVTAVLTAEATSARTASRPAPSARPQVSSPPQPRTETPKPARAIVAIASAKGGVGKSTVAVNLAVAAAKAGLRVGLLDADVFGPSLPTMMGTVGKRPDLTPAKKMKPLMAHGVATNSIGYLVDPDNAVVWRGPMVVSAVNQLIGDTDWGDLDILFIDTPPGTGEVQLTLVQRLPLDGAVIVSTPQEVALADVRRGVGMFRKTAVPVLGVIENMAWFEQPDGSRAYIFGKEGAQRTAEELGVPFLGALPILPALREGGDAGVPAATGSTSAAEAFGLLAEAVSQAVSASPNKPAPAIIFE
ncbi:MAG TPA: Mrp/NBP35 family ATP-binding protein [Hyphomonadaceae bacterium]|nr:Mrp/NBP35 family ATP-binding protein [Hyphomonadaceae bacterium]